MNNCKEYYLDDVMAVTAIPVDDFTLDAAAQITPIIEGDLFSPTLTNAIAIGLNQGNTSVAAFIPIIRSSGKAEDSEADSVAGRLHTVNVTCNVDDRDGEVWADLLALERSSRHLLLTFRGGERAFVAASQDTYLCRVDREGAKTKVTFRVQNIMGIQLIV